MAGQQKTEDGRFSERIREHARRLGVFTARDLADAVEVKDYQEKRDVSAYIRNYLLRGEMERVGKKTKRGQRYRLTPSRHMEVSNRQRLWNIVRRMPGPDWSLSDLRQITGDVTVAQVKRFGQWMVESGWSTRTAPGRFRRKGGPWPIDVPPDQRSTPRVHKSRDRRRAAAIQAMDRAFTAIAEARMAIAEMEDGHDETT